MNSEFTLNEFSEKRSLITNSHTMYGSAERVSRDSGAEEGPIDDKKENALLENLLAASTVSLGSFSEGAQHDPECPNLGTFDGVYVPCLLGIWGVILFERLPWIIGQAGLLYTLLMMLIALGVVVTTVLSVSAISTNGNMRGGGAYYMISRCLGPELGGSVGLIFWVAYIIAGGVFTIGFVEGFMEAFDVPDNWGWRLFYGSITLAAMSLVCYVGADFYAKSSVLIWIILVFSLVCGIGSLLFEQSGKTDGYTAWNWDTLNDNLYSNFSDEPDGDNQDFHSIFAIFFPALTGIMHGANMSGDLAKPASSIPKGTLWAIFTAAWTYLILMVSFAATIETYRLQEEYFIWNKVAFNSFVISVGIFAATLSCVMGSIIGCGNVLYALSRDEILPLGFLNSGSPRRSVVISWFFTQCVLFINELNTMATLQTMFFMFSYGMVNFACFTLILTGAPNFRPTWPYFNIWTCGLGVVLCFGGMFYVNALYASLSLFCALAIFVFILFRQPPTNWGDVSQAIMYHQVRKYLLRLDPRKEHVKFWRPQVLLLITNDNPEALLDNWALLDFVNNLKKGGLYVIGDVLNGTFRDLYQHVQQVNDGWSHLIDQGKLKAFHSVAVSSSIRTGVQNLILTSGVGMLKPNTIIIPFPRAQNSTQPSAPREWFSQFPSEEPTPTDERETLEDDNTFIEVIRDCLVYKKNVILTRHFELLNKGSIIEEFRQSTARAISTRSILTDPVSTFFISPSAPKTIDLWLLRWQGEDDVRQTNTITLLLLLGHILKQTDIWRKHTQLRVLSYTTEKSLVSQKTLQLKTLLKLTRITAEILVVPLSDINALPETLSVSNPSSPTDVRTPLVQEPLDTLFKQVNDLIRSQLTRSSIIFLPMPPLPPDGHEHSSNFMRQLTLLTDNLPPTLLLHSVSGSVITADL